MPIPLEWSTTAPAVLSANRSIPVLGTVICFIRTLPPNSVFVTAVLLPGVPGHLPEIIQDYRSDKERVQTSKTFFQEFVNKLEEDVTRDIHEHQLIEGEPIVPPPYVLLEQSTAIMCLSCGMRSYSTGDVGHRYCIHGAMIRALAAQAGLRVVVNIPGVPTLLTQAMQYDRLTLTVQGGFVTAAKIG